ncbi:MAG TPA: 23S rRNA (pseudouridine(1915)-N(3))-methyltransferase RlmH [Salinivirgaceae bacterium]|nr:23S rRNA (pseudouridine(1915)-N(3))-methyltransferase RlmH [Salinivirgaceae bacterium]HQA76468.1 23S rRNA (pseudouridine(1915)-N(3))-methyltransferase RlmH [Salinivirgaceae bacterium]
MKILLLVVGKTSEKWLQEGINNYVARINNYVEFEVEVIPDHKNRGKIDVERLKKIEGEKILTSVNEKDVVILLDEKGKEFSSIKFATWLDQNYYITSKRLVFVVGGAYGFSNSVYDSANHIIRLSSMTFSHQMVRLFFVEQLYRAFTIIKNEPYHH